LSQSIHIPRRTDCCVCTAAQHPLLAVVDEALDAVFLDVFFRAEAQLLFRLDFDPQALAVEPVLEALVVAAHGEIPLEGVFIGAAPGVVDPHRVVGGDRPVEKRPLRPPGDLGAQLLKGAGGLPKSQHLVLAGHQAGVGFDAFKHFDRLFRAQLGSLTIGGFGGK
jgi:hypothetical protein